MTTRRTFRALTLVVGLTLLGSACGGDDDDTAATDTSDAAATDGGADTTEEATDGATATDAGTADDGAETDDGATDSGSEGGSLETVPVDDGSGDSGSTDGGGALADLAYLDEATLCGLLSEADVEAALGQGVDAADYSSFEGLGSNCIWYTDEGFELGAKVEISALTYADSAAVLTVDFGNGTSVGTECEVGGRPAICNEAYEVDGFTYGASRLVQIGEPGDPGLYVEALDSDAAAALAEIAVTNFDPALAG